ncbi:MAG: calcium-binding protein [Phormidesmis sp. RL_2_1]|nr:calcium-binding protein [Phormidesmis sp. RL_2_1]
MGVIDYGQLVTGLEKFFDPKAEGSFTKALVERLQGGSDSGDVVTALSNEPIDFKGSDGDDKALGSNGNDKMKGEAGNDTLYGMGGNDKLEGKDGNDTLYGGTGSDELKGGDDDDVLFGVDINDSLLGGGEIDILKGENGRDTFVLGQSGSVFYQGKGNSDYALIDDFDAKEGDRIRLSGSAVNYTLGHNVSGVEKGTAIFAQMI